MTSADIRFCARRHPGDVGIEATVVLEPERRESGPAIAAAAVLALAANHVILDEDECRSACLPCRTRCRFGWPYRRSTFGLGPEGCYIRRGTALSFDGISAVEAFVEKPDTATAVRHVTDGYLWSGNFLCGRVIVRAHRL
jgi:mannose-1-phosphate guanylyltransferase/mannose-6-phosphate isomerase